MANDALYSKLLTIVRTFDASQIQDLKEKEIRIILPCLVRYVFQSVNDHSQRNTRKSILACILQYQVCNSIEYCLTSSNFLVLNEEAGRELEIRKKLAHRESESYMPYHNIELEFERSEGFNRCRLVLNETIRLIYNVSTLDRLSKFPSSAIAGDNLIDHCQFLDEIVDVICILVAEMPSALPINEVIEALLMIENGSEVICRLIVNLPYLFDQACQGLIYHSDKTEENQSASQKRIDILCRFCRLNPTYAPLLRDQVISNCKMPTLAVALTLDIADNLQDIQGQNADIVCFVSGILLGNNSQVRNWFSQYLHNGHKSKNLHVKKLRLCLLREVFFLLPSHSKFANSILDDIDTSNLITDNVSFQVFYYESTVVRASSILRVYCAVKGFAGLKFDRQECRALLRLITLQPPANAAGVRFLVLGLCTILACPVVTESSEFENIILRWLQSLVHQSKFYESISGVHASFGETLLLVAIHFLNSQFSAIESLINSTLGMKLPIKSESLSRMKIMFTQVIFKEQALTRHAVTVLVTPSLNANVDGFLPIHCIYQLLRMKAFYKHNVQVKTWLYNQIRAAQSPLHSLMPRVIEAFVDLLFYDGSSTQSKFNINPDDQKLFVLEGFSDDEVISIFHDDISLASKVLVLYYVLAYQDHFVNKTKKPVTSQTKISARKTYSQALISQLPIRKLFLEAKSHQEDYGEIYPMLLRLLVTHHRQLCMVDHWLKVEEMQEELTQSHNSELRANQSVLLLHRFTALEKSFTQPMAAMLLLTQLMSLPMESLLSYSNLVIKSLPLMIEEDTPRKIALMVNKLWYRLSAAMSHQLWIPTIKALYRSQMTDLPEQLDVISAESLTVTPLIILKCDKRVFRCPPIFEIVLHILNTYMTAFRASLNNIVQEKSANIVNNQEIQGKEGIKSAFIYVQETAAIQILLEICLPTNEDHQVQQSLRLSELQEIRSIICSHLHQVFISYPNITKLVHFQSYPSELISMMVAGVPSMHVCLDFIPELINQPQLDKQLFGISLASHLAIHYPLQKSMDVANQILEHVTLMLSVLPANALNQLIRTVLPALARFGYAFPPMCEDIVSLLLQCGRIMHSSTSSPAKTAITYNSNYVTPDASVDCTTASGISNGIVQVNESNSNDMDISNSDNSSSHDLSNIHDSESLEAILPTVDILKAIEIAFSFIVKHCIVQRKTSFNHEFNSLST
ncbi:uncharacterized protein TRIADDRAFT_18353 [Trichoplax adhaerens]|uniref:Integrator complex subunit 2 n=1 Tax=Trichoplax adhaerens TaxID=10228 RepID=B3RJM0_TRIAD|nr:hypothetical protein TRIADDRAFT_18353 [Trichoplax adhaerens]EDV29323.1 hypothetical protein TRIADDRAFT_18353 [Trichoplax adhaerens]|eukprot:XP_002108525.1 hypothetical protein TRIADDRAFT_18353 [Trichoplax adhaerens]